jgi:3-isopropylmalate dehydrogenase/3-benzylmalate dehydrogenase
VAIEVQYGLIGEPAVEAFSAPLPESTIAICRDSDAILFGAVSQRGILELRREFDFYVNLRPVRVIPQLLKCSSLRREVVEGTDVLFVRELSSGIYFGPSGRGSDHRGPFGFHTMRYHDYEIRRVACHALSLARSRSGRLTVAHKENALPQIKWRELVRQEAAAFPEIEINNMLVDTLAMELVRRPKQFDVILAGNLFGDILSDLGGAITGSIGMLPSASLNESGFGLYEPVHGTAPDIAGKGIANPLGMLGSVEMMLQQWGLNDAARQLRRAQEWALAQHFVTRDLSVRDDQRVVSTSEMASAVIEGLEQATAIDDAEQADHETYATAAGR